MLRSSFLESASFLREPTEFDIKVDKEENEPLERMKVEDAIKQNHEIEKQNKQLVNAGKGRCALVVGTVNDFRILVAGNWELI